MKKKNKFMDLIMIVGELIDGALYQIAGWQKPRTDKLVLTHYAFKKMEEQQLNTETLKDVFRYGKEIKQGMIVRQYQNYSVGLTYTLNDTYDKYLIITCWKRGGGGQHV